METEARMRGILEEQRAWFDGGHTLPVAARLEALDRLERAILRHEQDLYRALKTDLGKSQMEAYMCEVGLTLSELRYVRKHTRAWSRDRRALSPPPVWPPGAGSPSTARPWR